MRACVQWHLNKVGLRTVQRGFVSVHGLLVFSRRTGARIKPKGMEMVAGGGQGGGVEWGAVRP